MNPDPAALSLTHLCERRLIRVGACPVLEITVTYPTLSGEDPACPVEVFNSAYRRMTEAFLYWGETAFGELAANDFAEAGPGAGYRFDRRVLVCRMEADMAEEGDGSRIRVTRSVWSGTRRTGQGTVLPEAVDLWRLPELTLQKSGVRNRPPRRREPRENAKEKT